jgi:SAM-dependent methyltransferase
MQDTLALLKQHHGDGAQFVQKTKETAKRRFDDNFWKAWRSFIVPVLSDPAQIADLGCGPGNLLQDLRRSYPQARLIGVEYAPYMLAELDNQAFEVINHDLHEPNLSIASDSLDAITNVFCIHEMNQPICLLQTIYRCLKPGGRCLIMDWVREPLKNYISSQTGYQIFDFQTPHHILTDIFNHFVEHNRYTVNDITWLLQGIGFTLLEQIPLPQGSFAQWIVEK